jgi:membrane protease YdiL (CAAX protease family)
MAVESKTFPAGRATPLPAVTIRVRKLDVPDTYRRYFTWAQIIIAFLFLGFSLWEPNLATRNRWVVITALTIFTFVLMDRPSLERLGLRLPKTLGASLVLGVSFTTAVFLVVTVRWAGGRIPASPTWPSVHLAWQYVIWAMLQEFMLQSFFFTRCERLFGGPTAVWVAATLFAAAHLPSPILTTFTLIGGLFFCEMFRRYRSIYPLGVVHALLGLTIAMTVPDSLLHHMRVGIGYLRY